MNTSFLIQKIKTILFFFLFSFSFSFLQSCDPCANVVCNNGGVCQNGSCQCAAGYEGNDCSTESRAKFLGNYEVRSTQTNYSDPNNPIVLQSYNCEISAGTNVNEIVITTLNAGGTINIPETHLATVSGNEFTLSSDPFNFPGNYLTGTSNQYNANGNATTPKFHLYYRNDPPAGTIADPIVINADFFPL